jgi:hypothetical protein
MIDGSFYLAPGISYDAKTQLLIIDVFDKSQVGHYTVVIEASYFTGNSFMKDSKNYSFSIYNIDSLDWFNPDAGLVFNFDHYKRSICELA